MNILPTALLFCAALLLAGCGERKADVALPKHYEKDGLTFLYPGNWTIDEDEDLSGIHHISIETRGDALVIVQLFPMGAANSLEEYAAVFSKRAAEALPLGKMTSSKFITLEAAHGCSRLQENCNMRLLNEDTPHVRYYLSRDFDGQRCFLICQVAEEDLAMVEEGFKQVGESLLYEKTAAAPKAP